jgi:hypothetical protein
MIFRLLRWMLPVCSWTQTPSVSIISLICHFGDSIRRQDLTLMSLGWYSEINAFFSKCLSHLFRQVLPGIWCQTQEDVFFIALFDLQKKNLWLVQIWHLVQSYVLSLVEIGASVSVQVPLDISIRQWWSAGELPGQESWLWNSSNLFTPLNSHALFRKHH